ncbi:MAG TPA: energy transducer TonB [Pyrinomonadaceae bacterium]|nr:energy transducer TonB [Pyrinomonadaceae bacterium]
MNTKVLLCVVVMLVGVPAAAAQDKVISLADLDLYYQHSEKASFKWPWSVRTTVEMGDAPKGQWKPYSSATYSVVPPDRGHFVYTSGRKGEFIHIGAISYSKADDGTWSRRDDTIKGSLVSPSAIKRFGDGEISYTESRSGDIRVVTVISKPSADADHLDPRTRTYISYFDNRGVITCEESVAHNGTNWVRTTHLYIFDPNIRIEAPDEKVAGSVPPAEEAAKNPATDEPLRILSKPRPGYTDEARMNSVQGSVILKVTFEANGTIGAIEVVKGLERGLTEMTEEAARKITFIPARQNGTPVSVTKQLEYHFSVY